jgi:hypothetical protein
MRGGFSIALLLSLSGLVQPSYAQGAFLPWGQHSDMVAWEGFAQITAPAGNPKGKKVEFETWASDEDIYVKSPAQWPSIDAPKVLQPSALARASMRSDAVVRPFAFTTDCTKPQGLPPGTAAAGSTFPPGGCIGEEVRRNWASFQYIVSNGLDSRAGLGKAFASGLKVDLPADAIEFKGDWASVADVAKWQGVDAGVIRGHYYTSSTTIAGVATEIALLSFHISSKQVKNWVWSDFEGAMNPGRCDFIGCRDSFGAANASVTPNPDPNRPYGDCPKTPALKAMLESAGTDAVWQNYCLKGTQVTLLDENGKPTLLGNSVIEPLNANVPILKSSCITCHGYASFGENGKINFFALLDSANSPTGNIDPSHMIDPANKKNFTSNDFMWGISLFNLKAQ